MQDGCIWLLLSHRGAYEGQMQSGVSVLSLVQPGQERLLSVREQFPLLGTPQVHSPGTDTLCLNRENLQIQPSALKFFSISTLYLRASLPWRDTWLAQARFSKLQRQKTKALLSRHAVPRMLTQSLELNLTVFC